MVEHVGLGGDDDLQGPVLAQEVGRQHLDRRRGRGGADCADSLAKWLAPPSARSSRSTEVTTTWLEPSLATASATCSGSVRRAPSGSPVLHVAKCAGAGAGVAEDHESGVLLFPAFADVGTARLFADGRSFNSRMRAWVEVYCGDPGARARIQFGFFATGWSGLCAFSGCRGRGLMLSMRTVMDHNTTGRRRLA